MKMKSSFGVGLLSVLLLSSCTLSSENAGSFTSLFESHVDRAVSTAETIIKDSDLAFEGAEDSTLRVAGGVGVYGSGEITGIFYAESEGISRASIDMSLSGVLNVMGSELIISEIKGSLISFAGDLYARLDTMSLSGDIAEPLNAQFLPGLEKYLGKYISFRQEDISTDPADILAATIQRNLYSLTLEDVKKIIVQYPPLQATSTGVLNGNMYTYDVELNKENLQGLIVAFAEEVSGSGISQEDKDGLMEALSGVTLTGVLAFDKDDALYFTFSGQLSVEDDGSVSITAGLTREAFYARVMNEEMQSGIELASSAKDATRSTTLTVTDNGATVGVFSMLTTGKILSSITGSLDVENTTSTLTYTRSDDGVFVGIIELPLSNSVAWSGSVKDDALTQFALHIAGSDASTLDMDLTSGENGWIQGPLTIKQEGAVIMETTLELLVKKETFGLRSDTTLTGLADTIHFEVDATSVRSKKSVTIEAPTDAIPFMTVLEDFGYGSTYLPEGGDVAAPVYDLSGDTENFDDAMLDTSSAPLPENQ